MIGVLNESFVQGVQMTTVLCEVNVTDNTVISASFFRRKYVIQ